MPRVSDEHRQEGREGYLATLDALSPTVNERHTR